MRILEGVINVNNKEKIKLYLKELTLEILNKEINIDKGIEIIAIVEKLNPKSTFL